MGRVWSAVAKPFRNFNIENRAQKTLNKQTKTHQVAPRHPTTAKALQQLAQDYPEHKTELQSENAKLLDMLKTVRVESFGPAPEVISSRSLPKKRENVEDSEYGFHEPNYVPDGKITLKQALDFISQHQVDPVSYSTAVIAKETKLELAVVQQVLRYFQTFHIHIPKAVQEKFPSLMDELNKGKLLRLDSEKPPLTLETNLSKNQKYDS